MGRYFKAHAICEPCWKRREPDTEPHRLIHAEMVACCFCGSMSKSGIHVRTHVDEAPHCSCDEADTFGPVPVPEASRGKERDWIRWGYDGTLFCERCAGFYKMALPAPLDVVLAITRSFGELHAKCPPEGQAAPPAGGGFDGQR